MLLPVARFAPTVYYWRIRSRIYRWYGELKFLELEVMERFNAADLESYVERLKDLEKRACTRPLPIAFTSEVYTLRQHIDMVRQLIKTQAQAQAGKTAPAANPGPAPA